MDVSEAPQPDSLDVYLAFPLLVALGQLLFCASDSP